MIRARAAGDAAVLLEPPDGWPAGLAAAITAAQLPGVLDVVPGAATVLVSVRPGAWQPDRLAAQAEILPPAEPPAAARPPAEIEVCYDGPDLGDVAEIAGLTAHEVMAKHEGGRYDVGWLGFSPGFGYLTGLDPVLAAVPRLDSPRLSVPAGSVAIAGGLTAVYPAASPGGWRIIGRTSARLWDPDRDPPALLAPGMQVRFRAVGNLSPAEPSRERRVQDGPWRDRPLAGTPAGQPAAWQEPDRWLEVLHPGPLATVQDLGRPGLAHLGVPSSGAADQRSIRLANALVGNVSAAACLEATLGRLAVGFSSAAVAAVTGAPAPLRLTGADGEQREPPAGAAFEVTAGSVLRLGAPSAGLRSYLAVDGGFDVPMVLGSRSADLLSGLGPDPLRAGQWLPLGPPVSGTLPGDRRAEPGGPATRLPVPGAVTELRVIPGPRDDWFAAGALAALTGGGYRVTPASDRTGLRLAGPVLHRAAATELPSEGMATGSLQVSHDGQPILLLADHPVTGGYPVIAVVRAADVGVAAQLRPGQEVRFRLG